MSDLQPYIDAYALQLDRRRSTIFDVYAEERDNHVILTGEVLDPQHRTDLLKLMQDHGSVVDDQIVVLRDQPDFGYAVVSFGVLDVRLAPSRGEELVTEARFGDPVEIIRRTDDWFLVRLKDGYLGWVRSNGLQLTNAPSNYLVQATHKILQRFQPVFNPQGQQVKLLPWGTAIPVQEFREGQAFFTTPDGLECRIDADSLININELPAKNQSGVNDLIAMAHQLIGVPYLWGGTTAFGLDCSGFAQSVYAFMGVDLPRDADQQSDFGQAVARDQIQAGDLIFWGVERNVEDYRLQKINHVSVALDTNLLIHANQRCWSVTIDPIQEVQQRYVDADNPGIVSIKRLV